MLCFRLCAPGLAPARRWCRPGRVGQRAALEEAQAEAEAAAARPEAREDDEDEEEALPHSEAVDVFQEGLAMVVQDPLLCDLPIQVRASPAGLCEGRGQVPGLVGLRPRGLVRHVWV